MKKTICALAFLLTTPSYFVADDYEPLIPPLDPAEVWAISHPTTYTAVAQVDIKISADYAKK